MKSLFLLRSRWMKGWIRLIVASRITIGMVEGAIPGFLPGVLTVGAVTVGAVTVGLGMLSPVHAYTTEDLETVYRVEGEDYNALVRRAEITARSSAQQKFDSDILLTRVVITVLGQNGGQLAPILVLDVNRNDWRNRPDPQYWAKYYRSARVLLELGDSAPLQALPTSPTPAQPPTRIPGGTPLNSPLIPGGPPPGQPLPANQLLPSGASSPPSINIPAAPAGQVGLPRAILRP